MVGAAESGASGLRSALEQAGFGVTEEVGSSAGLARLEGEAFEVVIADASIQDFDLKGFSRRVGELQERARLLLLTDQLDNRVVLKALGDGASQVLQKPARPAEIVAAVGLMIAQHRQGQRPSALKALRPTREFTATAAKNEFGRVLDSAIHEGAVVITKHDQPRAILMSYEEFQALTQARASRLDSLSEQFDALLARMQAPEAQKGMKAAFDASPEELGEAAVAAVTKRG